MTHDTWWFYINLYGIFATEKDLHQEPSRKETKKWKILNSSLIFQVQLQDDKEISSRYSSDLCKSNDSFPVWFHVPALMSNQMSVRNQRNSCVKSENLWRWRTDVVTGIHSLIHQVNNVRLEDANSSKNWCCGVHTDWSLRKTLKTQNIRGIRDTKAPKSVHGTLFKSSEEKPLSYASQAFDLKLYRTARGKPHYPWLYKNNSALKAGSSISTLLTLAIPQHAFSLRWLNARCFLWLLTCVESMQGYYKNLEAHMWTFATTTHPVIGPRAEVTEGAAPHGTALF